MFKITIEEITEKKEHRSNYQKIADSGNPKGGGAIYDYVSHVDVVNNTRLILEQNVETLDVGKVIKAINFPGESRA